MNYYVEALKKYAVFNGRASRGEFWYFYLCNVAVSVGLSFLDGKSGVNPESNEGLFITIYQMATLIPGISVGVRRMHDINKNGLYFFIPLYGFILTLTKGNSGENKYGLVPKG